MNNEPLSFKVRCYHLADVYGEIVKEILGVGDSLSGWLVIYDALGTNWRKVRVKPDPSCPLCGTNPTIHDLSIHAQKNST